jgi:hypothetical protein
MKHAMLIVLFGLLAKTTFVAQDTISVIGTGTLQVKVLEVTSDLVKYKLYDFQDGPIYTVIKSAVEYIHYESGNQEVFTITDTISGKQNVSGITWAERGRQDALLFYSGKHSGAMWVGGCTVLLTPVFGWIPALAVASFPPSEKNLNILDYNLRRNETYYRAYLDEAHKIKRNKVWSTYGNVTMFIILLGLDGY